MAGYRVILIYDLPRARRKNTKIELRPPSTESGYYERWIFETLPLIITEAVEAQPRFECLREASLDLIRRDTSPSELKIDVALANET